ncbi:Uncharacterised protein [Mycobacteroides abscessus]|nr:Uncharacterised protein [Mycobacteroides abscessus]
MGTLPFRDANSRALAILALVPPLSGTVGGESSQSTPAPARCVSASSIRLRTATSR